MLLVIVLSLTGTMYVAWQFATEQEESYNTQRLIRKEAAVQRSLEYTLDRLPYTFQTKDIPIAFSDRICELADIHGMDIALYQPEGKLLTQSTLDVNEGADISLSVEVMEALSTSDDRIQGADYGLRSRCIGMCGISAMSSWALSGFVISDGHWSQEALEHFGANWPPYTSCFC